MTNKLNPGQQQALEACVLDTVSFAELLLKAKDHPKAPLLFNGLIANVSMFVCESYQCLTTLFPDIRKAFSPSDIELLRVSRHRAKLLDSREKTIEEVTQELVIIAKNQRGTFLKPHGGFLGPLKRILQPDTGLSLYDGHIFTTTHSTIYEFGTENDFSEKAFAFGEAIGAYTATLHNLFQREFPSSVAPANLPGKIEMRDIKYEALINRGQLSVKQMDFSAGLILILANLNFVLYILPGLLSSESPTLFRIKFITAFHANSGLQLIQSRLMANKLALPETKSFLKDALGNEDSRWLRKRRQLRNLLTHYLPDQKTLSELPSGTTRVDAIEHLGGSLTYAEIDTLLDRYIAYLSSLLESVYRLEGDPFWLGKVK